MGDIERDELRQYVADLEELTATMRRRESLTRDSPEWKEAVEAEERLIARIEIWARRQNVPRANEGDPR
jgi:hypothetical protein